MLFLDPLKPEPGQPRDIIKYYGVGEFFQHFENECFVIADGVPGTKHAAIAAQLAAQTALWGYKLVRQRPSYWLNRDAFTKRIFRSTNISLWQKHREEGFEAGLAASLLVCMFRSNNYWVGSVGSFQSFLLRDGVLTVLTTPDVDRQGNVTKMMGRDRFGLVPGIAHGTCETGDVIVLIPCTVARSIGNNALQHMLNAAGTTEESLSKTVESIVANAKKENAKEPPHAVVIKRVKI